MKVSLPTDSDGFLSRECPSCGLIFKALFGEGSDQPLSHCPYCGFEGLDCWHTQQQVEYAKAVAMKELVAPELEKLKRSLGSASGGMFKFKLSGSVPNPPPPPMEVDAPLRVVRFPCCNETVKVIEQAELFCVICGEEVDMETSDAKRLFLSHKGVDKEMVRGFKSTLEQLGYQPWLDEDAMPAGTSLERGLLEGMKKSCGVIFFITPSFKDEGYLQTEVDYAVKEKREKCDRFAIITLQFRDENGNTGSIPELLKHYVWKTPGTQLEALREIVRALPVSVGPVDWRDEISGVARLPQIKSKTAELSPEAKAILLAAVESDGTILHPQRMGGELIQVGNKNLVEDNQHKTVARWKGGLEDLQRRRFISDLGHNGTIFEVTREGYEAAESLKE